jgi:site-specific recombinase XerD
MFWVSELLSKGEFKLSEACGDQQELLDLAKQLPGVLIQARSSATNLAYKNAFQKWMDWSVAYNGISCLPASPQHVALYLIHVGNIANSFSTVNLASCAITWGHQIAGFESPVGHVTVSQILKGLQRKLACPKNPKEPFTVHDMQNLCEVVDKCNLTDLRNTCLMLLTFYGFLRFSEVVNLRLKNVVMHKTHVELKITKAKNDQLRLGNIVVISALKSACPV